MGSHDRFEREANQIAARVASRFALFGPAALDQSEKTVPRSAIGVPSRTVGLDAAASAVRAPAGGRPLPERIRIPIEHAFGFDFNGVKVHADADADELNRTLDAAACTAGPDIFFRRGAYEPRTRQGQQLIAHELTHVAQQSGPGSAGAAARAIQCLPLSVAATKLAEQGLDSTYGATDFRKWVIRVKGLNRSKRDVTVRAIRSELFEAWVKQITLPQLVKTVEEYRKNNPPAAVKTERAKKKPTEATPLEAPTVPEAKEMPIDEQETLAKEQATVSEGQATVSEEQATVSEEKAEIEEFVPVPATTKRARDIPAKLIENQTRLGFEIEPGAHLVVNLAKIELAKELVNHTLAETEYLEFLIDDPNEKNGDLQVEFRTKPLTSDQLENVGKVADSIRQSINAFPLSALDGKTETAKTALTDRGWTPDPAFDRIAPYLRTKEKTVTAPRNLAQHVTHSIPLAGFAKLKDDERELLIPGSGGANSVVKLIRFFFALQLRTLTGTTILITTTGRNAGKVNVKTAIDTLIGLLPPDAAEKVRKAIIEDVPTHVQLGQYSAKEKIRNRAPEALEELPQEGFPKALNTGYISAEEKLKEPLFDALKRDIRVLVEHRDDPLVKAVNQAIAGDPKSLNSYLAVFAKLDNVKGDDTFQRWFK